MRSALLVISSLAVILLKSQGIQAAVTRKKYLSEPELTTASAAYFRKIEELVPYETTAKIVFAVTIPQFEEFKMIEISRNTYQMIQNATIEIKDDFEKYLRKFDRTKRRQKRQVMLAAGIGIAGGILIHSIYTKIENKLTGSEEEATLYISKILEGLRAHQQEFLFFKHHVDEYAAKMSVAMKKFNKLLQESEHIDLALLHLYQLGFGIGKLRDGLERCTNHLIPIQIISDDLLKNQITFVETQVKSAGFRLAFSAKDLITFEKMKIADCFVTDSKIYILINVPLTKTQWNILQLIPVPFAFSNQTCSLTSQNIEIVAFSKESVRVIDSYMLQYCDFTNDHLCLIPEFSGPSGQTPSCSESLYRGKRIEDLSSLCRFQCTNSTLPQVMSVEKSKLVATNVEEITVECPQNYHDYKVKRIGSVQITIKCNCSISFGNLGRYNGNGICKNEIFLIEDVVHVVPNFLTLEKSANTLGNNWPDNVPVLTYGNKIPKSPDYGSTDPAMIHYRDWWLMTLSLLVGILLLALILACYCIKKLR